ncbi:MAG: transcriptional repressor, partial [Candidatus Margulisiibacteriota bacterium]
MRIEEEIFYDYLQKNDLRCSAERKYILKIFLDSEEHLTIGDVYQKTRARFPKINESTIYRNLLTLAEMGLAAQWRGPDKKTYFEHKYRHGHHDHMICDQCGKIYEFVDPEIENRQEKSAHKHKFQIRDHKLVIYGLCRK